MKLCLAILAVLCVSAQVSTASVFYIYRDPNNGVPISLPQGATSIGSYLSTSWVFGEVTPIAGYVGQPMYNNGVGINNPGPNTVTIDLFTGIWAADGAGGGPGTRLDIANTNTVDIPTGTYGVFAYSNFAVPAGSFWMGFALDNQYASGTTAADLNQLQFLAAGAPTVGATPQGASVGTGSGIPGNNPGLSAVPGENLAQFIQFYVPDSPTPEPAPAVLIGAGVAAIAMLKRRLSR
jgi:hypothetical protein